MFLLFNMIFDCKYLKSSHTSITGKTFRITYNQFMFSVAELFILSVKTFCQHFFEKLGFPLKYLTLRLFVLWKPRTIPNA